MTNRNSFSGRIYSLNHPFTRADVEAITGIGFISNFHLSNWDLFKYISREPLNNEEFEKEFYEYPILISRGKEKIIVLSGNTRIVNYFDYLFKNQYKERTLGYTFVDIHNLIIYLKNNRETFIIPKSLHCNYIPKGDSLRSISFYGDDVLESDIVQDNFEYFTFFKAGFRLDYLENQFITLGNNGSISLNLESGNRNESSREKIETVNKLMTFLKEKSFFKK